MVAKELGGRRDHAELSDVYNSESTIIKRRNNSFVMHIGELTVGSSRHRALLLKWLADACELPCRLVRGEFYLGGSFDLGPQWESY